MVENKKYFSLALSVDCVVFGFDEEELKVLLIERGEKPYDGYWALPGNLLEPNEDLNDSAHRVLKELTGLSNLYLEQVETFGEVDRHPDGRVLTVSYYSLIKISDYKINPSSFATEAKWFGISKIKNLAFDHAEILKSSFQRLKKSVRIKPIGFELLPSLFTHTELLNLYESILQVELDKRNFRKKIVQMNFLVDTGEMQKNVPHRPAKLYKFDKEKYDSLIKSGFNFEL